MPLCSLPARPYPWGYGTSVRKNWTPIAGILALGLMVLGRLMLTEEPPGPPVEPPAADTGMSEAEREAFMRTIGYVQ